MAKCSARVVVVDDEPLICELMKELLTLWGYEVECANSALDALAILEARGCHLALIDMMMPGMTGEELAPLIKQRSPGTPVVMISAFPPKQVIGVDQIFSKPLNPARLKSIVETYLSDDVPFSEWTESKVPLKVPEV